MIRNLFSIFDPSTYYIGMGWLILIVPTIILTRAIKIKKSKKNTLIRVTTNKIKKETITLTDTDEKKLTSDVLKGIFFTVMVINLIAILPMNFTPTAHISITVFLRITIWIATIVNAIANSMKSTIIHLTPIGTPTPLINFIVIIETIRNIIRPITLAVRLTANIVAGHLLMRLLSRFSITSKIMSATRWAPMITLIALEIAVAMIQAYVITILICLYYKETF